MEVVAKVELIMGPMMQSQQFNSTRLLHHSWVHRHSHFSCYMSGLVSEREGSDRNTYVRDYDLSPARKRRGPCHVLLVCLPDGNCFLHSNHRSKYW